MVRANRRLCIMRLKRALEEMVIDGVKTSVPLHQALMHDADFIDGNYTIKVLYNSAKGWGGGFYVGYLYGDIHLDYGVLVKSNTLGGVSSVCGFRR